MDEASYAVYAAFESIIDRKTKMDVACVAMEYTW